MASIPGELPEQEPAFSREALARFQPTADRRPFRPSTPVADDAPAIERLVACLGGTVFVTEPDPGA